MKLHARVTPISSVVGQGIALIDDKGGTYCQLAVIGARMDAKTEDVKDLATLLAALINQHPIELGMPPEVQAFNLWTSKLQEMLPKLPGYMRPGMEAYVLKGQRPGGFWCACLEGDWDTAKRRADINNRHLIGEYCIWIAEFLPPAAWGDVESVNAWVAQGGLQATLNPNYGKRAS